MRRVLLCTCSFTLLLDVNMTLFICFARPPGAAQADRVLRRQRYYDRRQHVAQLHQLPELKANKIDAINGPSVPPFRHFKIAPSALKNWLHSVQI